MTIKILSAWNAYPKDQIVTLSGAEETRLVGLNLATFDLDGVDNDSVDFGVRGKRNPLTGGLANSIWNGTQAQYDAIATKDANTVYMVA